MPPRKRLGQLLLELKAVDEHQLQSALGHQKQWGGKLGTILVQKGFIREDEMVRVLSQHVGMPAVRLADAKVDARAVKMISKQLAEKLQVFAFDVTGTGRSEVVTVAMSDPTDLAAVDQLAFHTGKRIKAVLSGASEIVASIHRHYDGKLVTQAPGASKSPSSVPPPPRLGAPAQSAPAGPALPMMSPALTPAAGQPAFGRVSPQPPPGLRDFRSVPTPAQPMAPVQRRPEPPRATPPTMAPTMAAPPPRQAAYVPPPVPPRAARAPAVQHPPLEEIEPHDLGPALIDPARLAAAQPVPAAPPEHEVIEGLESIASSSYDDGAYSQAYAPPGSSGLELDDPTVAPAAPPPSAARAAPPSPTVWVNSPEVAVAATPQHEPADWETAVTSPGVHAPVSAAWGDAPPAEEVGHPHEAAQEPQGWDQGQPAQVAPSWDEAPAAPAAPSWESAPQADAPPQAERWEEAAAAPPPADREAAFGEAPADWSAGEPHAQEWQEAAPPAAPAEPAWDAAAAHEPVAAPLSWEGHAEAAPAPAWAEEHAGELPAEAILGEAGLPAEAQHEASGLEEPSLEHHQEHQEHQEHHEQAAVEVAPAEEHPAEAAQLELPAAPAPEEHAAVEAGPAHLEEMAPVAQPPPPPADAIAEEAAGSPEAPQAAQEHSEAEAPAAWGALEDPLAAHQGAPAEAAVVEAPHAEAEAAGPAPESSADAHQGVPAGWENLHLAGEMETLGAPAAHEQTHQAEAAAAAHPAEAPAAEGYAEAVAPEVVPPPPPVEEELSFSEDELADQGEPPAPAAPGEAAPAEAAPAEAAQTDGAQDAIPAAEPAADLAAAPAEEPANGVDQESVQGWIAPPPEEQAVGSGWLGAALAATSPLSASEAGTLMAAGVDPSDGAAALRVLAGLLRVLHRRGLLDFEELAGEVQGGQPEAPPEQPQAAAPPAE